LARQWQEARIGGGGYGLGVGIRRRGPDIVLTHVGRVALKERGGAFVIQRPGQWTAAVTFAGAPRAAGISELRGRLDTAMAMP
jgi:hypothetical protein